MSITREVNSTGGLRAQVDALEQRLATDRGQLRTDWRGIRRTLRAKLVSPGSIAAAVAFGVIIERSGRDGGWSLTTALNGLGMTNQLAVAVGSIVKSLSEAPD